MKKLRDLRLLDNLILKLYKYKNKQNSMAIKKYKKRRGRQKKFVGQFKENLRIGLSAAVGFVIAFAWREPIWDFLNGFVLKYVKATAGLQAGIYSALIITIIGVIIIYFIGKWLK